MDQLLRSAGQHALEDAFHRLFELSRAEPAPALELRLDRLRRLRAAITENEARFEAAISADFGHRSTTETVIAETMLVLGEIKHAARHLKKWMAPQRISTTLQFAPAKNRLIPQPLGVVGIIAPWNYPLQLTLAPAVAALAAGNRVMIKPSELVPRFSALLQEVIAGKFAAHRVDRDRHRGGNRQGLRRAAVRSPRVHWLDPRRPAGRGSRRPQPDAGHTGARRQIARHRRPLRRHRRGRPAHRLRKAAQRRADLHRAGLCVGAGSPAGGFRRAPAGTHAAHVRYRPGQCRLHFDRLGPALCTAGRRWWRMPRAKGARIMQAATSRRSPVETKTQIPADDRRRRDLRDGGHAGGDFRAAVAGHGLSGCRRADRLYQRT